MPSQTIIPGLIGIDCGNVNAFLIDAPEGLILIDTGFPGKTDVILQAVAGLGKSPSDLKHIILTHAHYDHIGGAARLVAATGAKTWMHQADVAITESGTGFRPMRAAPGLLNKLMFTFFVKSNPSTEPTRIDATIADGDILPLAGGIAVIGIPGHCLGQVALLWRSHGVLFAADAFSHMAGLGPPLCYENQPEGEASQRKLAAQDFQIACFGHGKPIMSNASADFRKAVAK